MNFIANPTTLSTLGLPCPNGAATLGIRPEDLELTTNGGLPLQAKVVEMLGASQQVTARVNDELVRVSTGAEPTIAPDQTIHVSPKPGRARWYDAAGRLIA